MHPTRLFSKPVFFIQVIAMVGVLFANAFASDATLAKSYTPMGHQSPPVTQEMRQQNAASVQRLLPQINVKRSQQVFLDFPLRSHTSDPGFYVIGNHVDLNPEWPGSLTDFACGMRTYDTDTGYNHQGVDFGIWPFPWYKMDRNEVSVVAAADGVITSKSDGNYDRNCGQHIVSNQANYVVLLHEDGSESWYVHLQKGSVTEKSVGMHVSRGEHLGFIGSSGQSTAPHLHFELVSADGAYVEPSHGACQTRASLWSNPYPYNDSKITKLSVVDVPPEFVQCNSHHPSEEPNYSRLVEVEKEAYVFFSFQDELLGHVTKLELVDPDGVLRQNWTHFSANTHVASIWYIPFTLDSSAIEGWWTLRAVYQGQTHNQTFFVNNPYQNSHHDVDAIDYNLNGSWHNPDIPGQGLNIEILPNNQVVAFWYTYDDVGKQQWFILDGEVDQNGEAIYLDIYKTDQGRFNSLPLPLMFPWGQATLTFTNCTLGDFSYQRNGALDESSIQITRLTAAYGSCTNQ